MIKIFHTGDNHLDSSFFRLAPSERERERARQRELFSDMMGQVAEQGYDVVLIGGDLLDTPNVSPETETMLIESFSRLRCPVVISPGNHDPYALTDLYSSDRLPENVYVFNSPELQVFDFDELGFCVCGYAFMSDSYEDSPLASAEPFDKKKGIIKLFCAHGELGVSASKYAPISESDIERLGFSYAALGHIHKKNEPKVIGRGLCAYCGFPEGRAFDEEGYGGALSVTIDGESVSAEKIIFAKRQYICDELDVSGAEDDAELAEKIRGYILHKEDRGQTALRLTLQGVVSAELTIDVSLYETMFAPELLKLEIIDRTLPKFDVKSLENDFTLRGEVYRTLLPKLESEDKEERKVAAEALKVALLAIEGRRII